MKYLIYLISIFAFQNIEAQEKKFEWTNHSLVFQNDVENEVAYIDFGNNKIWGWIEVTLTASYSHRLATGKYTKRFSIGKNTGNEGYFYQDSEVPEAFDRVAAQWKIGKLEKGANGNLRLPIYHIDTKQNSLLISVKGNSLSPVNTSLFSVIDSVILVNNETRDHVYFRDTNVGIGTDTPDHKLDVKLSGSTNFKTHDFGSEIVVNASGGWARALRIRNETTNANVVYGAHDGDAYISTGFDINVGPVGHTFKKLIVKANGDVGIGTTSPDAKLAVDGNIHTKEVKVDLIGWADFVFEDDYKLPTLEDVEEHIKKEGHLKDIPSAEEVAENGVYIGDMNSKLLQKIEELTLYIIDQNKRIQKLENASKK